MKLTDEQINEVLNWMNKWEQLEGTAIPIRFKEDFTKQLHKPDVSGSLTQYDFVRKCWFKNKASTKCKCNSHCILRQ